MTGLCGLCRQVGELQESHLLPRAAYKHIRDSTIGVKGDPVLIRPKRAQITSRQATALFLCSDGEQRFHEKGENFILRRCAIRMAGSGFASSCKPLPHCIRRNCRRCTMPFAS
jgi:hypothetical protein